LKLEILQILIRSSCRLLKKTRDLSELSPRLRAGLMTAAASRLGSELIRACERCR